MAEVLLRSSGLLCCVCGMGWLALAMEAHWQQVRGTQPLPRGVRLTLRVLSATALVSALLVYLQVDHGSMAALVWVMSMTASMLVVAFVLAWKPRSLSWLVAWVRAPRSGSSA